jgi:hypothetical protein
VSDSSCFWKSCSNRKRCAVFGSCIAIHQRAHLDKLFPEEAALVAPLLSHLEILSLVAHHAREIIRLTAAIPVSCSPDPHTPSTGTADPPQQSGSDQPGS